MLTKIAIFLFLIMMIIINYASYKHIKSKSFTTIYAFVTWIHLFLTWINGIVLFGSVFGLLDNNFAADVAKLMFCAMILCRMAADVGAAKEVFKL